MPETQPKRGLHWRPSDLGEGHFEITWHEGDGRQLSAGRIFFSDTHGLISSPPWMWTVDWFQRKGRMEPHQGRVDSFEAALVAFKACWNSAAIPINWPPSLRLRPAPSSQ